MTSDMPKPHWPLATIRQRILYATAKDTRILCATFVLAFVQIYATILSRRDCVPYTQGAELSALIYAWKDMATVLPALSAVAVNRQFNQDQRDAIAHLLYLQAWMDNRKSPLSTQLTADVSGACRAGRSGSRQAPRRRAVRRDPRTSHAS